MPVICRSIGHVTGTLTAPEVGNRSGVGDGSATLVGCDASSGWRILPVGSHVCPIRATPARRWCSAEDKSGTALTWILPFHRDLLYAVAGRRDKATRTETR